MSCQTRMVILILEILNITVVIIMIIYLQISPIYWAVVASYLTQSLQK